MATENGLMNRSYGDAQIPVALQSLCSELSRSGQHYLRLISALFDEIAPAPGSLVYLHINDLGVRLDGLDPVVFSAIDACTNLQVAQIHLASTVAGTMSFIDHMMLRFPFAIRQIKMDREFPVRSVRWKQAQNDIRVMLAQRGILHAFVGAGGGDAMYSITSRLLFTKMGEGTIGAGSEREHYRALTQYLLYHNNYRSIPWLNGNTPLQKLRTYEGFSTLHSFCTNEDPSDNYGIPVSGQAVHSTQVFSRELV